MVLQHSIFSTDLSRATNMTKRSPVVPQDAEPGWPIRPLIPGSWRTLSLADTCAVVGRLTSFEAENGISPLTASRVMFQRGRILALSALPGWALIELEAVLGSDETGYQALLLGPGERLLVIDWTSRPVHQAAAAALTWPPNDTQVAEYCYLFCNAMAGDGERFRVVGSLEEVDLPASKRSRLFKDFNKGISPFRIKRDKQQVSASVTMVYRGDLFRAELQLLPSGHVEMNGDTPICPAYVCREELHGSFRVMHAEPYAHS